MSYWLWYLCESCKYHSFVHFLLCLLHNMSSHYSHSYFHFGTSITFSKATCNTLSLLITSLAPSQPLVSKTPFPSAPLSSLLLPLPPNGWVLVYEPSGCGFESRCCHLNVRYRVCFEQGVPWHSRQLWSVDLLWNAYVTC